MIKHLKNNYIIYLLLILVVIVILAIKFIPKEKETLLDTSMFDVVDTKGALDLFEDSYEKAQVLMISRLDCSASINNEAIIKIAIAQYHFYLHYLELSDIDENSEEGKELIDKLDYEYTLNDKHEKFSYFLGATPMFTIIKNGKMVYGNIGSMSDEQIKQAVQNYGATYE